MRHPLRTAAVAAVLAAIGSVASTGPATASPPPISPTSGSSAATASVRDLGAGSAVTAPQFFEVRETFEQPYFIFYPGGGPMTWQHVVRIPSLDAARPGAATYAVVGAPLPDDFILSFQNGVGLVATNPRPYGDPAQYSTIQTADLARDRIRATPQLPRPGGGTIALAITLPGAAAGSVGFNGAPVGSLAPVRDAVGSADVLGSLGALDALSVSSGT